MFGGTFAIILFLTWNKYVDCNARLDPLVQTKLGLIKGLRATDGDYSMFLGIPYATVDKDNPFGASTPHFAFDTVFEAVDDSAVCPQYDRVEKKPIGTIDCLHMNIFIPNTATSQNRLPVFVWIYGGRFQTGSYSSAQKAPQFLLKHDVIVVTFNYRVGPYGFMCLDTPEVPGNAGLKDQLLALRWVKDNIESFGGDVNQITLGGQSAGAVSVDFHLRYDKENYFHRAIMNSGTANCPWAIVNSDRNEPIQLAEILGYTTNDFNDAVSFLSKADSNVVIAAKNQLSTDSRACVEKTFDNIESFITDYPININIPRVRTTPILIGYTNDELFGEYLTFPMQFYEDPDIFSKEMSIVFDLGDEANEMGEFYKHFYVGGTTGNESKFNIIDFESDLRFNYPAHRSLNSYLENGAKSVYHYIFSYQGSRNQNSVYNTNGTVRGVSHSGELPYIFDSVNLKDTMSPKDQIMIDRMTTMYTNFVKYGDPTPDTSDLLPIKWNSITNKSLNYLNIDFEMKMGTRPFHERLTFWDLIHRVYKSLQIGYRYV